MGVQAKKNGYQEKEDKMRYEAKRKRAIKQVSKQKEKKKQKWKTKQDESEHNKEDGIKKKNVKEMNW